MWKIFVGFIAFAAIALFIIMKAGDKVDMQGESAGMSRANLLQVRVLPPARP